MYIHICKALRDICIKRYIQIKYYYYYYYVELGQI